MRSWIICLFAICLLVIATGCQSPFSQAGGSRSASDGSGSRSTGSGSRQSGGSGSRADNGSGSRNDTEGDVLDPLGARDSNRVLLDDLSPSQFSTTWKTKFGNLAGESTAQQYYSQGQQLFNQGTAALNANPTGTSHQQYFTDAANSFRLASVAYPDSTLEEDAAYFEGESYFFADRYVQANRAFEKLIANYSGTRHLDNAEQRRYAIAVYWLKIAENTKLPAFSDAKRPKTNVAGEARRVLHRIRIDDPTGKLADDATLALGKAFMQANRFYEAADTFEDLRTNYPASKHRFDAHMLELQCRLEGYQGKSYDDTPLRKADELMKTIVKQFPKESAGQLPYLEAQATEIQNQLAQRDYSMATYFEGRGENLAAKIYYEEVADRFQNTQLAATVEQQVERISQLPPRPKQHAKWLIDMFPDPDREKPLIVAGDNEGIFR